MHVLSGKANTARIALSVFGELRAAGVEPDLVCFNAAISAAGCVCVWGGGVEGLCGGCPDTHIVCLRTQTYTPTYIYIYKCTYMCIYIMCVP